MTKGIPQATLEAVICALGDLRFAIGPLAYRQMIHFYGAVSFVAMRLVRRKECDSTAKSAAGGPSIE